MKEDLAMNANELNMIDVAWTCAPDVHEERHTMPGASDPRVILLRQGGGLRRQVVLSTVTAAFASVCCCRRSARPMASRSARPR